MKISTLNSRQFILTAVLALQLFTSCQNSATSSPQQQFKSDSTYYMALKAIDQNNTSDAIRLFTQGSKKGSYYNARRCAEALTQIGTTKQKTEASIILANKYNDNDALLVACRQLYKNGEYIEIINLTKDIDLKSASDELIRLRIESLLQRNDYQFEQEFYNWIITKPLSKEHSAIYQIYLTYKLQKFYEHQNDIKNQLKKNAEYKVLEMTLAPKGQIEQIPDIEQIKNDIDNTYIEMPVTDTQKIIDFRVKVFRKDYPAAFAAIDSITDIYKNKGTYIDSLVLSDIGKACLYGSNEFYNTAKKLDDLNDLAESQDKFYLYFYAARLYDKAGKYFTLASNRFKSAMAITNDEKQYDNSLWYLLNLQIKYSENEVIATLQKYSNTWHDSEYFDDFFESLSVLLLANKKWQTFYNVWSITQDTASAYTSSRFAYIAGRLVEEGLALGKDEIKTRTAVNCYTKILSGSGSLYYKICAIERLNIVDPQTLYYVLYSNGAENEEKPNADALSLLKGYSAFGFPQKIYPEWLALRKSLDTQTSMYSAQFLNECGNYDNTYKLQSLRIASRARENAKGRYDPELLKLAFPRHYNKYVSKYCSENDVPEYLMYALIRSESFFDANVSSKAGAQGLTQLMEGTANDEARKLKIDNYDILDPEINIAIGTHYLKSLIDRSDGSAIQALFAYNAGLRHVRNWIKSAKRDLDINDNFANDLFLEILPFEETREYGRKVISAAVIYAWLYYGKTPVQTVKELMR